jgi:hypothetical protein
MQLRVSHKLGATFGLFIVFIFAVVFSTLWMVEAQKHDSKVINIAGRQSMLTQKMTKEALNIYKQTEIERYREAHDDLCAECHESDLGDQINLESFRNLLRNSAKIFSQSMAALMGGGEVPYKDDQTVTLPPTHEKKILEQMERVDSQWQTFNDNVKIVLDGDQLSREFQEAVDHIEAMSSIMMAEMDQAVRAYESSSTGKVFRLKIILWIILGAGFRLTAFGLLMGDKVI